MVAPCGSPDDLTAALVIVEDSPIHSLTLNQVDYYLQHIPEDASFKVSPFCFEVPTITSGFDLVSSPIGPCYYCQVHAEEGTESVGDFGMTFLPRECLDGNQHPKGLLGSTQSCSALHTSCHTVLPL